MKQKSIILLMTICMSIYFSCTSNNVKITEDTVKYDTLTDIERTALEAAQKQLAAYNNRDIEDFLDAYSDSVKVYGFPGKLNYEGKEAMRKRYSNLFAQYSMLHCTVISEIVKGNKVVHEEMVVFDDPEKLVHAVCIYIVENGKITEAHFL